MEDIPQKSPRPRELRAAEKQTLRRAMGPLAGLYEDYRPGFCIICACRLPAREKGAPGRVRVICDSECAREYRRLHKSAWRATVSGEMQEKIRRAFAKWHALGETVSKLEQMFPAK